MSLFKQEWIDKWNEEHRALRYESIKKLRRSRNTVVYIAIVVAAFASTNQFMQRHWLLRTAWTVIWLCWMSGMFVNLKSDKLMEELYGHRRDAENDQSSAAQGTEDDSDKVATTIPAGPFGGTLIASSTHYPSGGTGSGVTVTGPPLPTPAPEPKELEVYTSPVWGFREWNITDGAIPSLNSPQQGLVWRPGKNTARCPGKFEVRSVSGTTSLSFQHEAPGDGCWCGFHALRELFDATGYAGHVLGGVVGWGKVIDGKTGWRSEHAAVAALLDRPIFIEDVIGSSGYPYIMGSALQTKIEYVADLYGVPLCHSVAELVEKTEAMAKWMAGEDLAENGGTAG